MFLFDSTAALAGALCRDIHDLARECVDRTGSFLIAYPGGSVVGLLGKHVGSMDTASWHWALVDERHVPPDHAQSNFGLIARSMPHGRPIVPECLADAEQTAAAYEDAVKRRMGEQGKTAFDAVVLGVGPDGHVASLFPGRDWSGPQQRMYFAVHDSPKPPPDRITLSIDAICQAGRVFVVICGADKADALDLVLRHSTRTPLSRIPHRLYTEQALLDACGASKDI